MKKLNELRKFKRKFPEVKDEVFDYFWHEYVDFPQYDFHKEAFKLFNEVMEKRLRVIDPKFKRQVQVLAKGGYTLEDFERTLKEAKDDEFHIETGYKYLTPEYITRVNIWDKYYVEEKSTLHKVVDTFKA